MFSAYALSRVRGTRCAAAPPPLRGCAANCRGTSQPAALRRLEWMQLHILLADFISLHWGASTSTADNVRVYRDSSQIGQTRTTVRTARRSRRRRLRIDDDDDDDAETLLRLRSDRGPIAADDLPTPSRPDRVQDDRLDDPPSSRQSSASIRRGAALIRGERHDRVDAGRAARRDVRRQQADDHQERSDAEVSERVGRADLLGQGRGLMRVRPTAPSSRRRCRSPPGSCPG